MRLSLRLLAGFLLVGGAFGALGSEFLVSTERQLKDKALQLERLQSAAILGEIGAGLAAAFRQRGDVVAGNILGSNVFNILGAGGIVALFGPFEVAPMFLRYDHWVMGAAALLFAGLILLR